MLQQCNMADIVTGMQVEGFYLLREIVTKTSANGSFYWDIILGDKTGQEIAKMWNIDPAAEGYTKNTLVKIRGKASEWQGKLQIRIDKMREVSAEDELDLSDFVPVAPEDSAVMYGRIFAAAQSVGDEELQSILVALLQEHKERLLYYPAAQSMHHSVRGGLLFHVDSMLKAAQALLVVYPFLNRDLLISGVIVHDIGKLDEMNSTVLGLVDEYTKDGILLGHIQLGIAQLEVLGQRLGIPREKVMLLQHMILSHHYEPEFGSPKLPMFAEAEMLHYLDVMDARMYDFEAALSEIEPGAFTARVRHLERRLYKPELEPKNEADGQ